jgi:hypothetical protein
MAGYRYATYRVESPHDERLSETDSLGEALAAVEGATFQWYVWDRHERRFAAQEVGA